MILDILSSRLRLAREKQEYRILADWYKFLAETYANMLDANDLTPEPMKPHPHIQHIIDARKKSTKP